MGVLRDAFGFGTAQQSASSSMNWGAASTGMSAAGDLLSGIGQSQMFGYSAQVAANNATISKANAGAALAAGQYEESASKLHTGQVVGEQRTGYAANGIDVGVGSPVAVKASTETVGAMDAAMIHYNAARAAYGETVTASNYTAQSKLDRMAGAGAVVGGLFKAGGTLLSGASALGAKYAGYKLSGAAAN